MRTALVFEDESAAEGYPTLIASRAVTTEELWLAVAAGGLGLPPDALLWPNAHEDWINDRLRVLDLRVFGGHDAHAGVPEELLRRSPTVVIVDDYSNSENYWDATLDPIDRRLDLNIIPRRLACALVLGGATMASFSDWLDAAALSLRLVPDDDGQRTRVSGQERHHKESRIVLLRDGYLEPPRLGQELIRRLGVTNIWEERSQEDIASFARTLAAEVTEAEWRPGGDEQPPCG